MRRDSATTFRHGLRRSGQSIARGRFGRGRRCAQSDRIVAESSFQHGHPTTASRPRWLVNTLPAGRRTKLSKALAHFHATAKTPHRKWKWPLWFILQHTSLWPRRQWLQPDYKFYPSVHTLLLLANALQLARADTRKSTAFLEASEEFTPNSPEFLITLAESEFDASIYPAARDDLERAIALDSQVVSSALPARQCPVQAKRCGSGYRRVSPGNRSGPRSAANLLSACTRVAVKTGSSQANSSFSIKLWRPTTIMHPHSAKWDEYFLKHIARQTP